MPELPKYTCPDIIDRLKRITTEVPLGYHIAVIREAIDVIRWLRGKVAEKPAESPAEYHAMEQVARNVLADSVNRESERRMNLLAPYGADTAASLSVALADMAEATFQQLLESTRLADVARKEAAAKQEADRLAAIEAKRQEDERIRVENERLRLEAEAAARQIKAEREAAETARRLANEAAAEERRKANLKDARVAMLAPYFDYNEIGSTFYDLANISEAAFQRILETARLADAALKEAAAEEQRKAYAALEAKRIADAAEAERQRAQDEADERKRAANAPGKERLVKLADELDKLKMSAITTCDNGEQLDIWNWLFDCLQALAETTRAKARKL